jgi:hydrophobic/amphiphilic exporter-1 (mainly G- bacteria), HAE1 family
MNITDISIRRPSLIIVLFSVFALLGIIGYKNLSYELMPDFNQPVVVIRTGYPGADPSEVEQSVSKKIEDALANLEGVDYLATKSLPNASIVIANLMYGTDLDKTMQDAQRYIDNIRKDLPKDVQNPVMSKVSPNDLPIMAISATSELPASVFYQKMVDEYLPQVKQLKGVAEISVLGGERREIQIKLNRDRLANYRISMVQVVDAIHRAGLDVPAGSMQSDGESQQVRLKGKFTSIQDLEQVIVSAPPAGSPVFLRDVAHIADTIGNMESYSRFNGKPGLGLLLKKQGDANAVEVSRAVRQTLMNLQEREKDSGLAFIIADDSTDNTIAAVESVVVDLIWAVILVSLVMLLFLRSFRNALIVLVAIPTSLVTAIAVMWLLGYTLNLMSLLAMSLIIGILVDDATVVLENIQRHLDRGKEKRQAALDGRMEIGFSAISITLVDVVVFIPILFLQVFVADMLRQFSVVVVTATLTSLLVGFTLTPWLASRIGKKEDLQPRNAFNRFLLWFEKQLDSWTESYGRQLQWVLKHKLAFTGIVLVLFLITGMVMKQGIIGRELISTGDQGKFRLTVEFDKYTSVQKNNAVVTEMEKQILGHEEVKSVFTNVGGPSSGIGSLGVGTAYKTEYTIQLKPKDQRGQVSTEQFMRSLRDDLAKNYPGIRYAVATLGLIPRSAPIEITLSGQNTDIVMNEAKKMRSALEKIPGADHVRLSVESGSNEYKIVPDPEKMQRLGLNAALVGLSLRTAITGNDDALFSENETEYPIRIWLDSFDRRYPDHLNEFSLINPMGMPIKVAQFADIVQDKAPSLLERKDRLPAVTITAEALGRPSGSVADDVLAWLKENPLPSDIQLSWGSDIKRQQDSFGALGSVLLISFLLIYLIMVALYDSFVYPFVVLFSIPVAAIGAFLALNLSLSHLSLFALLGLIMLMGLVVKNAILIVDFTNQLKSEGLSYAQALIQAGKGRLRPILMTTLSMVFGMLPIALAKGTAAEWKNGLAWVIIGGLLSSLVLTIYLVPMMYYLVDRFKEKWNSYSFRKEEKAN